MKTLNYLFCLALFTCLIGGCKKNNDNPTPVPVTNNRTTPTLPSKETPYLGVYLNDSLLSVIADTTNTNVGYSSGEAAFGDNGMMVYMSMIFGQSPSNFDIFVERSITPINSDTLSETGFKAIFKPGSYSYVSVNDPLYGYGTNGFNIRITPTEGANELYTKYGPQEGSTFSIKEADFTTNMCGDTVLQVIAEFNCKLYDKSGNFKMDMNHGIYRGYFKYEKFQKSLMYRPVSANEDQGL